MTERTIATDRLLCDIDGCESVRERREWCGKHYARWRRLGTPDAPVNTYNKRDDQCSANGCEKPVLARGWCDTHHKRWYVHGDPTVNLSKTRGMTASQRFEHYYERSTVTASGCVEWAGPTNEGGYGTLWDGERIQRAHRISWEKASGKPVPDGLSVLHSCDNPPCVNPAHLRVGTEKDNSQDSVDRCRQARGERINRSHLTESDVLAIRDEYTGAYGEQSALGRKYGVTPNNIRFIVLRKTWAWLT